MACELCGGSLHVQSSRGWVRCSCLGPIIDRGFIKPQIRGTLDRYPEAYESAEPWGLVDQTRGGHLSQLQAFKFMAWRSLVPHRDRQLAYDYIDSSRLVDVMFNNDANYKTIRVMSMVPLIIFMLGLADIPNKLINPGVSQLLTYRKDSGLPTWIFTPYSAGQVANIYGSLVAGLVGPVLPVTSTEPLPKRVAEAATVATAPKKPGGFTAKPVWLEDTK